MLIAAVAGAASLMCGASMAQHDHERIREYRYAIIQVPGLGGGLDFAWGMNDHGQVVGQSLIPDNTEFHAFVSNGRTTKDLGTFGGNSGVANDINNEGWVVGAAKSKGTSSNYHAFFWPGRGEILPLEELHLGTSSTARGINNKGQIVGSSDTPEATIGHAVIWEDRRIRDLGTLEGSELNSSAFDINEQGFVTGWSGKNKGGRFAFLWDGTDMIAIGSLGDGEQRSEPWALNESLVVVGQSHVNEHNRYRPCVYHEGEWHNLLRPVTDKGFEGGNAYDINDNDEIVGFLGYTPLQRRFGFIWKAGDGIQLLNDLIPPNTGWDIINGVAINKHGQIATWADPIEDPSLTRALLLTPIEPELTLEIPDGPLQADAINTFTITHAEPGAMIKFFYGKKGGGKRIPGCDALAAMTQIDDPVLFGEAVADADGNAELDIYIPPRAAVHKGFLFQAVDFQNCEESQLVLKKVE